MKQWILGTEYDLTKHEDQIALMDYIDKAKKRGASGDLHLVCYGLLAVIAEINGRKET